MRKQLDEEKGPEIRKILPRKKTPMEIFERDRSPAER